MGGARCSYRNCAQKSDKKTHMFHYPVFDKMRCHQWITNAQKQSYFNLKLSQLKNRMICEHHFLDDCFMNIMRNKLKNTAVPTEDGPFCTKSCKTEDDQNPDNKDELPINIDDIENEFMPMSYKQACLSVNYGEFLTNDISEISLTPDYKTTSIMLQDKGMIFNRFERNINTFQNNHISHTGDVRITRIIKPTTDLVPKFENTASPKVLSIEYDDHKINASEQNMIVPHDLPKPNLEAVKTKTVPQSKKVRIISEKHISEPVKIPTGDMQPVSPTVVIKVPHKKKKSNIEIDGQEIKTFYLSQNMQPSKELQTIDSGNKITHMPQIPVKEHADAYTKGAIQVNQVDYNSLVTQNTDITNTKCIDYLPTSANQSQLLIEESGPFINIDHMPTIPNVEFVSSSLTGPSVFTLTDIPQVTTFTHRTRDKNEIQNDLSSANSEMAPNLEHVSNESIQTVNQSAMPKNMISVVNEKVTSKNSSPNKSIIRKLPPEKLAAIEEKRKYNLRLRDIISSSLNNMEEEPDVGKLTAAMKKEVGTKKVGEHLPKNSSPSQGQEDIIAYFKTRLQRMEDTLLNKIEQNTQKIVEIKKTIKQSSTKKSTSTQTYFSAQATKRSLYEQISQYLDSDTNSLIYEQLFLNHDVPRTEHKRRKRRINND